MNKRELLLKPNWNYHDVCEYVGCQKSKAYQLIDIAKKQFNGSLRFNSQCVKRDSLLQALETTIERELYVLNQMNERG